jgi:hypothetical protein
LFPHTDLTMKSSALLFLACALVCCVLAADAKEHGGQSGPSKEMKGGVHHEEIQGVHFEEQETKTFHNETDFMGSHDENGPGDVHLGGHHEEPETNPFHNETSFPDGSQAKDGPGDVKMGRNESHDDGDSGDHADEKGGGGKRGPHKEGSHAENGDHEKKVKKGKGDKRSLNAIMEERVRSRSSWEGILSEDLIVRHGKKEGKNREGHSSKDGGSNEEIPVRNGSHPFHNESRPEDGNKDHLVHNGSHPFHNESRPEDSNKDHGEGDHGKYEGSHGEKKGPGKGGKRSLGEYLFGWIHF